MANAVYHLNRGINQSMEFKGLKAQYIWYLAIGVMGLLLLFILLYFIGLPSFINVGVTAGLAAGLISLIFGMSKRFGTHGLMKSIARRRIPILIRITNRKIFFFK
ncbi:MAG: DUF4133 domain-containing protein [Sphingobacterium sp.]